MYKVMLLGLFFVCLLSCDQSLMVNEVIDLVVEEKNLNEEKSIQFKITVNRNIDFDQLELFLNTLVEDGIVPNELSRSISAGTHLIHIPLKVTAVDGVVKTIKSIADLYDALGGASTVNFLITYDPKTQEFLGYFGDADAGTSVDKTLTDDTGIIVGMRAPVSVRLTGAPLGTNGNSTITLNPGVNLVGLPLNDSRITRVSDLFALNGIGGNVSVIIITDRGEFKAVGRAGDPGDIKITGGQAFIMTAQRAATVTISGESWVRVD